MPKVTEAHREQRRQQVLDGARHVFAEHGYFGTNVPMLEQEIGLSRGAIFNYFPSKLDLFVALAQEDRGKAGRIWLEEGFEGMVRHIEGNPNWIGVYLEVGRLLRTSPELRLRWADMTQDLQEQLVERYVELQQSGKLRSDVSYETILRFLGVVLDGLVTQQGAGYPIDVDGTLELVRTALAPK